MSHAILKTLMICAPVHNNWSTISSLHSSLFTNLNSVTSRHINISYPKECMFWKR